MKQRLAAVCCALALVLTGCSAMLNREYSSSSVHVEYPVSEDSSVLQAENYQGLVNAILYFVTEHQETGVIRLTNYPGEVSADVTAACDEVRTEDPLGAYAVESLLARSKQIVSYYEVTVSITFAHTAEEVAAIVPATGSTAIKQTLSAAMAAFSQRCVLRVSYFTGDAASLATLARQTYFDTPLAALAMPEIAVTLYPASGTSRIVEITLDWPEPVEELAGRRTELEDRALTLLEDLGENPDALTVEELLAALRATTVYDPDGGNTAYDALVTGAANDGGMVLALRLLCQLADLEATVAEGSFDGATRFWLILSTPEGYRHLDPTVEAAAYATDDAFRAAGYAWDESRYPDCTDYTAAVSGEPGEEAAPANGAQALEEAGADDGLRPEA